MATHDSNIGTHDDLPELLVAHISTAGTAYVRASNGTNSFPNSIGGIPNGYAPASYPLVATPGCMPDINPSFASIKCAGGHEASIDETEYIDGEVVSTCAGCGERIILPRVPGAIPILKLKAFVGGIIGLDVGGEDADFNFSELLGLFAELKRDIELEAEAVRRGESLLAIAERLIQQKLAEKAI